jgi:type I restriction enzyme M protein
MTKPNQNFEAELFKAADKLRKWIDAAEYKHIVLWLVFLKHISDTFSELYDKLEKDEFSDSEDRDEYMAENVFFVPKISRWDNIHASAKLPEIGKIIDDAMDEIEKENKELKNVLPKVFARENLDKTSLWELIDLISNLDLKHENSQSKDLFGRVYEYFLGEFANAEWKKWGQFYTPKCIVELMVNMIEPYKGRVYDPACGSWWMFVMSEKFVEDHRGNINDITIYGQESNQTTWKLSKMNLAIRNINSQFVKWNTEWSFLNDAHPDLKADFILANPPFNQSDWWIDILQDDARWKHWVPPNGNANYGWIQHMLYHTAPNGILSTVLANGSLSSNTSWEWEIRKKLIEADLVECIVALPKQLFYNTWIPACIWFLRRERSTRNGETLFIDASEMWYMKDRVHRDLAPEDIKKIADTYHNWRWVKSSTWTYEDELWYSKSADLEEMRKHDYVLTPGRYVGIPEEEDDWIPFEDKMSVLTEKLSEQMEKEEEMNNEIKTQLEKIGFKI